VVTELHPSLQGYWFAPTVFTNVSPAHRIAQEEIFGPFLGAHLPHTRRGGGQGQQHRLRALRRRVDREREPHLVDGRSTESRVVWANSFNRFDPTSPFGGYRESGFGREGGRQGLGAYLDV